MRVTRDMAGRITVSLSGAVGSGKSATARAVVELLRAKGVRAEHVRFQDFVAFGRRRRVPDVVEAGAPLTGKEAPGEPPRRQGYRLRPLTLATTAGYLVRAMLFRVSVRMWPKDTVLVFDRYFYDSLAHFDLDGAGPRLQVLERSLPAPTLAGVLLIPERTLLERRPRYSAEYARLATSAYERLATRFTALVPVRTTAVATPHDGAGRLVAELLRRTGVV